MLRQEQIEADRKKSGKARTPTATRLSTRRPSVEAIADRATENSELDAFLLQVRQERESFASRLVPGHTVALTADGSEFAWQEGHPLTVARDYALAITQGGIVAGELAARAGVRFLKDIETGFERGIFIDPIAVENICTWFHVFGQLELLPWEIFVIGQLLAWKRPSGLRRFIEAWIEVAKKNGKTYLMAGLALFLAFADGEPNAEVYVLANAKDQAKICFKSAVRIWNSSEELHDRIQKLQNSFTDGGNTFQVVSSDTHGADGPNVHGLLFDEVHEFADDELWTKYTAGIVARKQPLIVASTTAGDSLESFAGIRHTYYVRLLTGVFEADDKFCYIAACDKDDSYADETTWQKSNPSLGTTVRIEHLRSQIEEIKQDPSRLNKFLRYHCNVWQTTKAGRSLSIEKITAAGRLPHPEMNPLELRKWFLEKYRGHAYTFGGFDYGLNEDWTSFVSFYINVRWPKQEIGTPGNIVVVPHYWIPEELVEHKETLWRIPLRLWIREGWVKTTPGNFVDQRIIKQELRDIYGTARFIDTGFDPWESKTLMAQILDERIATTTQVPQMESFTSLPCNEFKRLLNAEMIFHLRNPVYIWQMGNVVMEPNPRGGIICKKLSRNEKVDSISATISAMQRALDPENLDKLENRQAWFFMPNKKEK